MKKEFGKLSLASSLVSFASVAILVVLTPGADWAFMIAAGLRGQLVIPALCGLLLGYSLVSLVVVAGLGALVATYPTVMTALTLVGAMYLVWLGWSTFWRTSVTLASNATARQDGPLWWVGRGFGISTLNPKGLLVLVAILPQFAHASSPTPVWLQLALFGAVNTLLCALIYSLVGFTAQQALQTRPTAAQRVGRGSGVIMIILGVVLIIERLVQT